MQEVMAGPVAHILVVGFHHKKGGQVEFCHPPIFEGKPPDCKDLPPQWKHLPCLALPDGSHNYEKDTIYFLLPGKDETKSTMFGVACYKQMKANDLLQKSSDVTRGTVQKSVVVLTELPLFGLIDVKLQLITHAYFAERDFSKISILKEFFDSMNTSLPRSMSDIVDSQVFIGLSLVELVKKFRHKTLILFKLLLLERRILFFGSPVHSLCTCLLSVISLFPEMVQSGLADAACPRYYKVKSPSVSLEEFGIRTEDYLNLEMSHVPNYSHARNSSAGGDSQIPSDRLKSGINSDKVSEGETHRSAGGAKAQKLSRTQSHDSAVKPRECLRIPTQGGGNAQNQGEMDQSKVSEDDEDRLLDMIDEELFGTYFEEKRDQLTRSFSEPERTEMSRGDGACSPNEMSSLLSHDVSSPNGKADRGSKLESDMGGGKNVDDLFTANYDTFPESSESALRTEDGVEHTEQNFVANTAEENRSGTRVGEPVPLPGDFVDSSDSQGTKKGDDGTATLESDIGSVGSQRWQDRKSERVEDLVPLPGDSLRALDSSDGHETKEGHDGTAELESGIGSMGSQRWVEEDPAPQMINRRADSDPRSSLSDFEVLPDLPSTPNLVVDDFGFPLSLFGKGSLFHPYMSLQQHDLLQEVSVRCFLIGASNVLFKHKRQILDVIVEIDSGQVTILDQELRKQLSLTTADLRFSDYVVNTVLEHNGEDGFNNADWEGGEDWIRAQFKLYLLSLLATCADDRPLDDAVFGDFNDSYVSAWRVTHNYRVWRSKKHAWIDHVHTRHICHGQLSINDMKIRWNSAMQNSERGKNLNQVINRTSVAMTNTGRAVGEALTSAKSVMSTWLFGFGGDDDDDQWTYGQE